MFVDRTETIIQSNIAHVNHIANLIGYSLQEDQLIGRGDTSYSLSPFLDEGVIKVCVPINLREGRKKVRNVTLGEKKRRVMTLRPVIGSLTK